MPYDLIALDLDGTALDSNNLVLPSTVKAVSYARGCGKHVVLATGRISGEAAEFARIMRTDNYMVAAGGATLNTLGRESCYVRISIPWHTAVQASAVLERFGLTTMAYIGDTIYVTPYSDREFALSKSNEGFLSSKRVVPSIADLIATERLMTDKLFCRTQNPSLLSAIRGSLDKIPGIRVMSSASDNLEVVSPIANKALALQMLCAELGTDLSRVIAIGDSENDIDMLRAAGMPVAMGNASPHVQVLAKYHTTDNDHDGVAEAIYYLLEHES